MPTGITKNIVIILCMYVILVAQSTRTTLRVTDETPDAQYYVARTTALTASVHHVLLVFPLTFREAHVTHIQRMLENATGSTKCSGASYVTFRCGQMQSTCKGSINEQYEMIGGKYYQSVSLR